MHCAVWPENQPLRSFLWNRFALLYRVRTKINPAAYPEAAARTAAKREITALLSQTSQQHEEGNAAANRQRPLS